jgi:hypothetical protein
MMNFRSKGKESFLCKFVRSKERGREKKVKEFVEFVVGNIC